MAAMATGETASQECLTNHAVNIEQAAPASNKLDRATTSQRNRAKYVETLLFPDEEHHREDGDLPMLDIEAVAATMTDILLGEEAGIILGQDHPPTLMQERGEESVQQTQDQTPLKRQKRPRKPRQKENVDDGKGCGEQNKDPNGNDAVLDNAKASASSTTITDLRVSAVTEWLRRYYEEKPDVSLPRFSIYEHYLACHSKTSEPSVDQDDNADSLMVNSATFGKIIKQAFPGIGTRRLGTRGNSKYHYYGIGLRAEWMGKVEGVEEQFYFVPKSFLSKGQSASTGSSFAQSTSSGNMPQSTSPGNMQETKGSNREGREETVAVQTPSKKAPRKKSSSSATSILKAKKQRQSRLELNFQPAIHKTNEAGRDQNASIDEPLPASLSPPLIDRPRVNGIPPNYDEFARFMESLCASMWHHSPSDSEPDGTFAKSELFCDILVKHATVLLELICTGQFGGVEAAVQKHHDLLAKALSEQPYQQAGNSMGIDGLSRLVSTLDDHLYQTALVSLFADVLEPIPIALNQAIRSFAKTYEYILANTFLQPDNHEQPCKLMAEVCQAKVDAGKRFCEALRRRTALNHLSQAVDGILRAPPEAATAQLLKDWQGLDTAGILEQAGWVVKMRDPLVAYVEQSIASLLSQRLTLPAWAQWVECMAEQCLALEHQQQSSSKQSENNNGLGLIDELAMEDAMRVLLHRWTFFGTMAIRDLTLRSAPSFGTITKGDNSRYISALYLFLFVSLS